MNKIKRDSMRVLGVLLFFAFTTLAKGNHTSNSPATIHSEVEYILTGVVKDTYGDPIPAVAVSVNDYERGTYTDDDGKYSINVNPGDKVSFSFIGFLTKDFVIKDQKQINVTLEEDVNMTDEIVLIGYNEEKRENIGTAVESIDNTTLDANLQVGSSFDKGLDGLMKGVFVTQGTGELGRNADIIIRGVTSPFGGNNNNPLYIIDGVAVTTSTTFDRGSGVNFNPLQSMNPEDIESITVLKDAAATAIYGSRGANGVILVKTKKGLYGQPTTVTFSTSRTIGKPIRTLDYLNAEEFKKHIYTLNRNSYNHYLSGVDDTYEYTLSNLADFGFKTDDLTGELTYDSTRMQFGTANTDWNKEVYRKWASTNRYNLGVRGGGETSAYGVSLGYNTQQGILRADKRNQFNSRLNFDFNINDNLKTGVSVNYTNSLLNTGYNNTTTNSVSYIGSLLRFRPDVPVYDENGNYTFVKTGEARATAIANPVAMSQLNSQRKLISNNIIANIFSEYHFIPSLSFKVDYSYSVFFEESKDYKPKQYSIDGFSGQSTSEVSLNNNRLNNSVVNYTLNYSEGFDKHRFTGLLGFSHTREKFTLSSIIAKGLISNSRDPQLAKTAIVDRTVTPSGLNSYFARLGYNYNDQFGISTVVRLDRSSKFARENRNAFFPSVSAYWNIVKDNYGEGLFNNLRLRASVGRTGVASVGDFSYIQRFGVQGTGKYNGNPATMFGQRLANNRLQWEKTTEYNAGLEFGLRSNILRGSVDLYHRTSRDVVSNDRVVSSTGSDLFARNNSTISNRGFEIGLGSDLVTTQDFRWSIDANAARNLNKLVAVSQEITNNPDNALYYTIGREVNLIKGYVVNGIIKTQARIDELNANAKKKGHNYYDRAGTGVGDYEYADLNGDGTIDSKDRKILGSRQPDLFGGFNTRVNYKGFEMGAYFSYALGIESLRGLELFNATKVLNVQRFVSAENRWSPSNPNATLPRLIHSNTFDGQRTSTANLFDASYLRFTALRLGYNLPERIVEKMRMSRFNVFVAATNLATWTSFPGIDPQGTIESTSTSQSTYHSDAYPSAKTFSVGLRAEF